MSEITISAKKFVRLLDYFERIGLDVASIAATVNMVPETIAKLDPERALPAQQYSRLYREGVLQMQQLRAPLPWAAGLGSEAFELMCHCVIAGRTLGDALRLAERFDRLLFPLIGHNMRLLDEPGEPFVKLSYRVRVGQDDSPLIPEEWDRAAYKTTVAHASGLLVWHAFCGWLTGRALESRELRIAAPFFSQEYYEGLANVFHCPIYFDADENTFSFAREDLNRRVVHTVDSLAEFLKNSVYHLIASEKKPASTSAAIKSLVGGEMPNGLPSFAAVASMLYMSESSLRRRLQQEDTSYQAIKDEIRCELAIDKILNENAKVADLAELLGFTEASSFVRSFKSWTGQTPRSYREKMLSLGER
jgi:AraC-like DNA-binding protein